MTSTLDNTKAATTEPAEPKAHAAMPAGENGPVLLDLRPDQLRSDPANVRASMKDLRGLTASIKALGILQPLLVKPTADGGWQIVAGHRRHQAAIAAGLDTVPCVTRMDLVDADAATVLAALGENLRREDLTELEEARGYQQVLDLGVSAARIARMTGSTTKRVKQALAVTASTPATQAITDQTLTLEQAAIVAEFDDDETAVADLLESAALGEGSFKHAVSRLRRAREDRARRQATIQTLVKDGITVIEDPDDGTWPNATPLRTLTSNSGGDGGDGGDGEGQAQGGIEPDDHQSCPGHAAAVDDYDPDAVVWYCTDPDAHGHTRRWPTRHLYGNHSTHGRGGELSDEEREARKAERREVIANNRAWRDAEPVRREHIRSLLHRKQPPKTTMRFVTEEIMRRPERVGNGKDTILGELVGTDARAGNWGREIGAQLVAKATDKRLPLVLLAQVAADLETSMDVHTWRQHHPHDEARWLTFLASTGYQLSHIEQHVIDKINGTHDAANVATVDGVGDDVHPGGTHHPDHDNQPAPLTAVPNHKNGSDGPAADPDPKTPRASNDPGDLPADEPA